MTKKLFVPKHACQTCPYKRDTPSGIWSPEEYIKLAALDAEPTMETLASGKAMTTFHCHQENATGTPTACRGWVWTHGHTMGMRLALMNGLIDPADLPVEDESHLYYTTGVQACAAGMADIDEPGPEARALMDKLLERGAGRVYEEDELFDPEDFEV